MWPQSQVNRADPLQKHRIRSSLTAFLLNSPPITCNDEHTKLQSSHTLCVPLPHPRCIRRTRKYLVSVTNNCWLVNQINTICNSSLCVCVSVSVCVCVCVCVCTRKHAVTLVVADSLQHYGLWPTRLLCPWDSPGKNTSVGCQGLLQGIFPTQGLNTHLLRLPALAGGFFTTSTIWEAPKQYLHTKYFLLVEFHEMIQVEMKQCCSLR